MGVSLLFQSMILICTVHLLHASTLYMIMEYNTDGTVILNNANFTLHTVSMNVTLLGCDFGYYDTYVQGTRPVASPKTLITPFDCMPCVCTDFESTRVEDFISVS